MIRISSLRWFLFGCLGAGWQILAPLRPGFGRGWEMLEVARTLAERGDFANPLMALPTGPTAMVPPAYPFLVSLLIRVFGDGDLAMWATVFVCILAHGLYVALMPAAAERLTGDPETGQAAALLAAVLPAFPLIYQWDTIFSSAGLLAYLALAKPGFRVRGGIALGAFAGFLSLWNPITSPSAFLRALFLVPRRRVAIVLLGAWLVGYFSVAGLWMARNRAVLGAWAPRTNLGTTLYVSNNDCASAHILDTMESGCYDPNNLNTSRQEAELLISLGEPEYDRARTRDSLRWMSSHPAKLMDLTLARWREYWMPRSKDQTPYAQAIWITTVLSLLGLVQMILRSSGPWAYLISVSLLVPVPYYFVIADIRYRAPILWVAQIAGGYFLARLWSKIRVSHRQSVKDPAKYSS